MAKEREEEKDAGNEKQNKAVNIGGEEGRELERNAGFRMREKK